MALGTREKKRLEKLLRDNGIDSALIDSSINYQENLRNLGIGEGQGASRRALKQQQAQQYVSNVQEATGLEFESNLGGEGDFKVLPATLRGRKGVEIKIECDLLTSQDALKNAVAKALDDTAASIVGDVTMARKEIFSDREGHNTIQQYGGAGPYYSSGMIPYWRGGLLGSVSVARRE